MNVQIGAGALVGRSDDISSIASSIRDPLVSGAWVCGPAGIGKSAVAAQVLKWLEGTVVPLTIHADASLSNVSYGPLAPLLLESEPYDLKSRLAVLRLIRAALHTISSQAGLPVLIIVHSAQDLDQESSHLLGQLALGREIRLLVLTRSLGSAPEELYSLCLDGLLTRCELAALSREQVETLSLRELGGIVSSGVTSFLADLSQGNPYIVRALISHLRSTGALVDRNGVWLLVAVPKSVGQDLEGQVTALLLGCSPLIRRAIETVALLGGIPATAAPHVLDAAAMEEGLSKNLLAYSGGHGGGRHVVVEPLVYGEVIRHLVPPGRRIEILRTLRESPQGREVLAAAGASTSVGLAMDLGQGIPDRELLVAARQANNRFASHQAQRFSEAVTAPEFATAARAESARSFLDLADTDAATAEICGLIEEATDLWTLTEAAVTETHIALRRGGDAQDIHGIAERWAAAGRRVSDQENPKDDPASPGELAECGAATLRHVGHCLTGDYHTAIEGLREVVRDTVPSSTVGLLSRMLMGEALAATGKTSEAKGLTLAAIATTKTVGDLARHYRTAVTRHGELLVRIMDEAGFALLRESFDQTAPPPLKHFGGNLMMLQGVLDFRCGRIDASCDLLVAGIEELRRHDPEMLLPLCLGTAAFASRLVGADERAVRYLQDYRALPYRGFLPQRLVADAYVSAAKCPLAMRNEEVATIEEAAAEAQARGLVYAEAEILELLFLLEHPVSAGRLEELANELGPSNSDTIRIIARAAGSTDPAQLVASAESALTAGRHLVAAECMARSAAYYGQRGEERVQRAVLQQLRGLIPVLGRVRTRAITDEALTRVALTRREHEIARLAAEGASSLEIATQFTVSRRTVEGHLYRIYLKLGIGGRDDLIAGLLEAGLS